MTQRENYLAEGFRDVDRQNGIEKFKTCLTVIDSLLSFRRYKEETDRLLRPSDGRAFADIGCGLGFDVERLARRTPGKAVGLDASQRLIFEARKRAHALGLANVDYVIGDARTMSFEDGAFDGVRADRTLQHIEGPEHVVKEMARIVRKGGRVVCAEPDWGSFFIEDKDAGCVEAVSREWTGSIKNRFIGRQLPGLLQSAGLSGIEVSGYLLATFGLREVDVVFDVERTCQLVSEKSHGDECINWYQSLAARDPALPVFAGVTLVIAAAVKQ